MLVQKLIGNFDVARLQLGDGHLLLDELQEQLLLLSDAAAHLDDLLLALFKDIGLQVVHEVASLAFGAGAFLSVLRVLVLLLGHVHAEVFWHVLVIVVVNDIVLVLADDAHGGEDVERVVDSPLHIFEIDLLTLITELLVHLKDLVGDLGASDHGPLAHLLKDGARQKNQLLVLTLVVVVAVLLLLHLLLDLLRISPSTIQ
mmetsp:Transcript_42149/g.55521  ORF Transcript_42149/g.55521 Transcript_42149/m.55521 type:complete len:201 (+) Transcript_42149:1348-1950(+)